MARAGLLTLWAEAARLGLAQPGKGMACGDTTAVPSAYEEVMKRWTQAHGRGAGWENKMQQAWIETRCIQTGYKEIIFHLEDSQAVAQVAGEVVLSPSVQVEKTGLNKPLSNPVWPHSWPHFEQEVGPETSQGFFSTWILLWFYIWLRKKNLPGMFKIETDYSHFSSNIHCQLLLSMVTIYYSAISL